MHLDRTHQWTESDLALLARLIRRKWQASRIAPVFHVTRNAVLGKIHRHEELKRADAETAAEEATGGQMGEAADAEKGQGQQGAGRVKSRRRRNRFT